MTLALTMITVDSTDPVPLAHWWSDQLGGQVLTESEGWFVVIDLGEGLPRLAFQKVDDPTPGKNRMHLDLNAEDPAAEVERLVSAGATTVATHELEGFGWTILADPQGNQFCVAGHD